MGVKNINNNIIVYTVCVCVCECVCVCVCVCSTKSGYLARNHRKTTFGAV